MRPPSDRSAARFRRVYYIASIAMAVALALVPVLVPLSFMLAGYDLQVQHDYSPESFEAYRTTGPYRRAFGVGVMCLAVVLAGLSIVALARYRCGAIRVYWPIALLTLAISFALFVMLGIALLTPSALVLLV